MECGATKAAALGLDRNPRVFENFKHFGPVGLCIFWGLDLDLDYLLFGFCFYVFVWAG